MIIRYKFATGEVTEVEVSEEIGTVILESRREEHAGNECERYHRAFSMSPPTTKELMKLTLEKRIAHGGHPVLRWMMDNIYIRTDPAGNIKADKEKSMEKIDGAVAAIMGLDRAIRCGSDTSESVYDHRGLLVF